MKDRPFTYCPKDNCEVTYENECEKCIVFVHFVGYFGCDWFECNFGSPLGKEEYIELTERLQIGL
jgi:hypothetical protein